MGAKYAQAVYGNLAYNTAAAAVPAREIQGPARERTETSFEVQRAAERQAARTRQKQSISVFAAIGVVCIAGLLMMMLLSYVSLTQISAETSGLNEQLRQLSEEETRLKLKYESALDLNAIESYATNVLGMSKPGENQIFYIYTSASDQAEVLDTEKGGSGLLNFFSSILTKLAECFG
jgi:cell division protein FtsB